MRKKQMKKVKIPYKETIFLNPVVFFLFIDIIIT